MRAIGPRIALEPSDPFRDLEFAEWRAWGGNGFGLWLRHISGMTFWVSVGLSDPVFTASLRFVDDGIIVPDATRVTTLGRQAILLYICRQIGVFFSAERQQIFDETGTALDARQLSLPLEADPEGRA